MKRVREVMSVLSLALLGLLSLALSAKADTFQTYNLARSGAALGNSANATGTITLDLTLINNPGFTEQDIAAFVTDFSITISGASSGDGTFGFSDYNTAPGFILDTGGGTLHFVSQLIGQPTPGGPWGSTRDGTIGDSNIFFNFSDPTAPTGTFYLEDTMNLTSFAPAVVPEPSSVILMATMLVAGGLNMRKRVSQS